MPQSTIIKLKQQWLKHYHLKGDKIHPILRLLTCNGQATALKRSQGSCSADEYWVQSQPKCQLFPELHDQATLQSGIGILWVALHLPGMLKKKGRNNKQCKWLPNNGQTGSKASLSRMWGKRLLYLILMLRSCLKDHIQCLCRSWFVAKWHSSWKKGCAGFIRQPHLVNEDPPLTIREQLVTSTPRLHGFE